MEKNRIIKIISMITGFTLIFIGQSMMYGKAHVWPGALFFLLSFIPFFVVLKTDKGAELIGALPFLKDISEKPVRNEIIGFVIFFIAAAYFRFHNLDTVPLGSFRDEGKAAKDAMDIIRNVIPHGADSSLPIYIRAITDNPALYNFFMGALFPLVGEGIVGARAATAVGGLLAAVSFYFLIRYMFGWRAAVLGGLLFAVGSYPVIYSRLVYHASFAILPYMFAMFFALKVYNERKLPDFILLGLSMGLAIQTYQAARIIPFAYAAMLAVCVFTDRGFIKANFKQLLITLSVLMLVLLPLIIYIFENFNSYMMRPGGLFLFSEQNHRHWTSVNPVLTYLESLKRAVFMYNHRGGISMVLGNFDSVPMVDFLSGIFAAAGFMLLLTGLFLGNARSFFFLGMFFIFIQGSALFIEAPHATRGVMAMPMVFIFAAAAIAALSKVFYENAGKISKFIFLLIAGILLLIIAVDNYERIFERFGKHKLAYRSFEAEKREAAEYVVKLGDNWQAIMTPFFMHGERGETPDVMIAFMNKGKDNYEKITLGHNFPVNPKPGMNYIYILERDYFTMLDALQAYYPGGERIEFKEKYNKENVTSFIAYKVPYEEAVKGMSYKPERGLTVSYYTGAECGAGELLDERVEPVIFQDWAFYPKNIRFFTACWDGKIRIDTAGRYFFDVKTGENKQLFIDNKLILTGNQSRAEVVLSKGMHDIHASFRNNGSLWFCLWWVKPNTGSLELVPMDNFYPKK